MQPKWFVFYIFQLEIQSPKTVIFEIDQLKSSDLWFMLNKSLD